MGETEDFLVIFKFMLNLYTVFVESRYLQLSEQPKIIAAVIEVNAVRSAKQKRGLYRNKESRKENRLTQEPALLRQLYRGESPQTRCTLTDCI